MGGMMQPNRLTASAVLLGAVGALLAATPAAAAPDTSSGRPGAAVDWKPCPAYSEGALRALAPPDRLDQLKALLARLQCGTVTVPLDYRSPRGRRITVALTRLPATDRAHRLGSLALNPGGPGGSGYLMPLQVIIQNDANAGLNTRYDLIGFDPRGVGYSTKVDCPPPAQRPERVIGTLSKDQARQLYSTQVAETAACGDYDPSFLGRLTTADVARDLDTIRAALGERGLNFLGVSWGTWLGVVYRTLFPHNVDRMLLDSVAIPRFDLTSFDSGRNAAAERNAGRFADWLAARDSTYHLGATGIRVRAAITAMVADFDAHPRTFTDLPEPLDGSLIAQAAAVNHYDWDLAGQVLGELRTAAGPTAPPKTKEVLGGDDGGPQGPPPADLPEQSNQTMNHAAFCNEDTARPSFDTAWADYQRRLAANPMTGRTLRFSAGCAGWPLPPQPVRIGPGGGELVLVGHRWETPSPYEWTIQTQARAGGRVYTVDDDVHGSVLHEPACAADAVQFFNTGRIDAGCPGVV
ncbi:alpha/beta hydrolase [Dactylosporangium matsuzakiense]|uniref:Tripeptidyl aminopeptidase n=2 Tax=Dactylosporangium matsuzakiense TaxID=53360 RepID=A0A9W6NNM0_9ACTN|nr:tripeptidyl aminopeptidase [Dactylosporangium matsuzakiense]